MYWFCISKAVWNACSLLVIAFPEVSCSIVASDWMCLIHFSFQHYFERSRLHWIYSFYILFLLPSRKRNISSALPFWCKLKNSDCNAGWFWKWITIQLLFNPKCRTLSEWIIESNSAGILTLIEKKSFYCRPLRLVSDSTGSLQVHHSSYTQMTTPLPFCSNALRNSSQNLLQLNKMHIRASEQISSHWIYTTRTYFDQE